MQKWIWRLAILLALVLAGLYAQRTWLAPKPIAVELLEIGRGEVLETITNSRAGTVEARRRARLSPEIGGTVVSLPFREGEGVEEGVVLMRLDDSLQRGRVEVAKGEVLVAKAERQRACLGAERASRELERMHGLRGDGIISPDQLDGVESAYQTANAACEAATAGEARAASSVRLATAELAKTVLRSPFGGVVADLRTEIGEYSTPAPPGVPVPPVLDVLDPSSIFISAPMDEVDSARIHPGQSVKVTVDSHRGIEAPGRVVRLAPYVLDLQEQNRTVEIEVELEDDTFAATLLPGTSADVEVILDRRQDVLRIPTTSLFEGRRVLVLEGDHLRAIEVEVGLRNWDYCEIRGGIEEGDRVVTSLDRVGVEDGALAVAEP